VPPRGAQIRFCVTVVQPSLAPPKGQPLAPQPKRAPFSRWCPGSGSLPVCRVSAAHPNPTWHPEQPSLLPPIPLTLHPSVPGAPPEPHRSTSVRLTEVLRGGSGGAPVRQRYERAVGDAVPPIPPKTAKNRKLHRKWINRNRLRDQPRRHTGPLHGPSGAAPSGSAAYEGEGKMRNAEGSGSESEGYWSREVSTESAVNPFLYLANRGMREPKWFGLWLGLGKPSA
jgi:hypothetical protein